MTFTPEQTAETFGRFMRMVSVGPGPSDCWWWTGSRPGGRYGHFSVGGEAIKAHRWIYALLNGDIPDGLIVRHRCDNPACVNPVHLEVGTHADNAHDKIERGRNADRRGEKHPMSRMTETDVRELRRLASMGTTHHALAERFCIARQTVGNIVRGRNWSHVQ